MVWFSKKKGHRLLKEFNNCLKEIDALAFKFRDLHHDSVEAFEANLKKVKTIDDLKHERLLFEAQFDVVRKLKTQTDLLMEEAYRLIRNEAVFTEADRIAMKKKLVVPEPPSRTVAKEKPVRKETVKMPKKKAVKKPKKKTTKKKTKKKVTKKKAKTAKKKTTKKKVVKKRAKKKTAKKKTKKKTAKKKTTKKKKKKK